MNWLAEKFVSVTRPLGDDPPVAHLSYGAGALESLQKLPVHSVHMVATSPPYWGLRDYGTEPIHWPEVKFSPMPGLPTQIVPAGNYLLGLEPTITGYVGHLVAVFREVQRVLRGDGVCFLNLGDSYANSAISPRVSNGGLTGSNNLNPSIRQPPSPGLKPKDLCMIPSRVALALQADGWWLRQDIIWNKKNPMPESVTDRCTKAHEYIFLLTKSVRYFWDADAVREKASNVGTTTGLTRNQKSESTSARRADGARLTSGTGNRTLPSGSTPSYGAPKKGRNIRSVWTMATHPYPGAHFATWPPRLVDLMIRAGTSERGCCPACEAPWVRVVEREQVKDGRPDPVERVRPDQGWGGINATGSHNVAGVKSTTTGWKPTCNCNVGPCEMCECTGSFNRETLGCARCGATGLARAIPKRCLVLDPFSGSATTGRVAFNLNRDYIGLDANSEYLDLAIARLRGEEPPQLQPEDSVLDIGSVVDLLGD